MPYDVGKILRFTVNKVEIGESVDGNEPVSYYDIGILEDESLKIKFEEVSDREITGANIQKAYDVSFEFNAMQVKDLGTLETYRNKNCWIKVQSLDGQIIKLKNFRINVSVELNLYARGKNFVKLKGTRYVSSYFDAITIT